ncbi:pantothenate transporter [Colletotrichum tofieldiae]|nr:pantothenate transporter [Colletotrichum tofieldiae]
MTSDDADVMTKQRDDGHSHEGVEEKNGQIVDLGDGYTPEEEKEVLRKIDLAIMPMYLDKQSLSYASVFGLITDLNLTSTQYSWCSSIFYVGQLVSEYPFIYLMSRFHLTKFVGITVVIWGIICMCLAAPNNYAGFAAVRFLLGFAEGAVSPAFITITSIWYRSNEHALRTALWITMNGVAQICGSLLMYGIARNTSLSLAPWRTLFLVCGAITSAAGVMFYLFMPNGPKDAWFLTVRQKQVLSLRMAKDREGGDKTSFSMTQLKEAATDIKTWFVFWFGVLVTMQSPVLTFASLVINNIGYDKYETMLYTAPSGNTKRAIVNAMFFVGYCAGCIGAPQLWTEKPRYFNGVITAIVTWCLLFVEIVVYRYLCVRDNSRRESDSSDGQPAQEGHGEVILDAGGAPDSDLTDKQDKRFRYSI